MRRAHAVVLPCDGCGTIRDTSTPGSHATKDAPLMSSTLQAHLHATIRTPLGRRGHVDEHVA